MIFPCPVYVAHWTFAQSNNNKTTAMKNTFREHLLKVFFDSIRNSCDVLLILRASIH